jgi:hypothetical protein
METVIIDILQQAAQMARQEGSIRPIITVASAEGTYNLTCPHHIFQDPDTSGLELLSALLRWSMTRAFVVACEEKMPRRLGVYLVSANEAEGFSVRIRKHSLRLRRFETTPAPPHIQELRRLIPPTIATLSASEMLDLEQIFGGTWDEWQPEYMN